ncbi:MAG: 30S ribosomal protein S1 [Rickettsiaceae bacterium H1]|nr:30S ribosomal protein S1 [Rickettsiaceae bacterium H1]
MSGIIRNNKSEVKFYKEINPDYLSGEDFDRFLKDGQGRYKLSEKENSIVEGVITSINKDYVLLDIGLKSEGQVPVKEFVTGSGKPTDLNIGDTVNVHLTKLESKNGEVILSRESAVKYELWNELSSAYENNENVEGTIIHKIKSGYIVDFGLIAAFLPNSHVDLKPVKDPEPLLNKKMQFRILKMDKQQGNIVVSRRVILDSLHAKARKEFLSTLQEGQVLEGMVKSITNYGVFVGLFESPEIGVVDGLLHITDISWSRISHPSAIYSCGEKITIKIINIDTELNRISLGKKQLTDNPWGELDSKYPIGSVAGGVVTSIEEYGIFVELEPGIEGLVHSSEISWTNEKVPIARGDKLDTMVLSVDSEKNRMSLSIKQCNDNPWTKFTDKFPLGSIVKCKIRNINPHSGINVNFVDYDGNISGFIYNRDLSWEDNRSNVLKNYKLGDVIDGKLLRVNSVKGGIFLGIKQIKYDPFLEFLTTVKEGDSLSGKVSKIEDNGIYVTVKNNVDRFVERGCLLDMSSLSVGERINLKVSEVQDYNLVLTDKHTNDSGQEDNKADK